jgi:hypothetical protein
MLLSVVAVVFSVTVILTPTPVTLAMRIEQGRLRLILIYQPFRADIKLFTIHRI